MSNDTSYKKAEALSFLSDALSTVTAYSSSLQGSTQVKEFDVSSGTTAHYTSSPALYLFGDNKSALKTRAATRRVWARRCLFSRLKHFGFVTLALFADQINSPFVDQ